MASNNTSGDRVSHASLRSRVTQRLPNRPDERNATASNPGMTLPRPEQPEGVPPPVLPCVPPAPPDSGVCRFPVPPPPSGVLPPEFAVYRILITRVRRDQPGFRLPVVYPDGRVGAKLTALAGPHLALDEATAEARKLVHAETRLLARLPGARAGYTMASTGVPLETYNSEQPLHHFFPASITDPAIFRRSARLLQDATIVQLLIALARIQCQWCVEGTCEDVAVPRPLARARYAALSGLLYVVAICGEQRADGRWFVYPELEFRVLTRRRDNSNVLFIRDVPV